MKQYYKALPWEWFTATRGPHFPNDGRYGQVIIPLEKYFGGDIFFVVPESELIQPIDDRKELKMAKEGIVMWQKSAMDLCKRLEKSVAAAKVVIERWNTGTLDCGSDLYPVIALLREVVGK